MIHRWLNVQLQPQTPLKLSMKAWLPNFCTTLVTAKRLSLEVSAWIAQTRFLDSHSKFQVTGARGAWPSIRFYLSNGYIQAQSVLQNVNLNDHQEAETCWNNLHPHISTDEATQFPSWCGLHAQGVWNKLWHSLAQRKSPTFCAWNTRTLKQKKQGLEKPSLHIIHSRDRITQISTFIDLCKNTTHVSSLPFPLRCKWNWYCGSMWRSFCSSFILSKPSRLFCGGANFVWWGEDDKGSLWST